MALANVIYTADGNQTDFVITFDYLDRAHVEVEVDNVLTTDVSSSYTATFQDDTTIRVTTVGSGDPVGTGLAVKIARNTPVDNPQVVFQDGAVIRASSLNANTEQTLFIAQEVKDQDASRLGLDGTGRFDARGARIMNVGDPVDDTDAVNKGFISTNLPNITTVAGIANDVTTVAGISTEVVAVAADAADIGVVAADEADIGAVALNIADVQAVADNETNIDFVVANEPNINAVAAINTAVTTVAGIAADTSTVAGISADVTAVAADATDIGTVAANIADVDTVALNMAAITTVANDLNEPVSEIETVGNNIADVTAVAANEADIDAVAAALTDVGAVAAIAADVATTAGIATDVTAVAADASDIGVVATNIADVNAVAGDIAAIQAASGNAATATTKAAEALLSATNAATSEANAAASASQAAALYDQFDDRYLGSQSADPTVNNDGDPLISGNLYFNNAANEMRVYDGANWIAATAAGNTSILEYFYTATAAQTTFAGSDDFGNSLSYTLENIQVTMNGIRLASADFTATSGTSVVIGVAAEAGDLIQITAFKSFTAGDMVSSTNGGTFGNDITVLGDVTSEGLINAGLTYPTTDGTSGQYLQTDGAGNLSFQTVAQPSNLSEFTDDVGYAESANLATVATTGAYSDLTGTPNISLSAESEPQLSANLDTNGNEIEFGDFTIRRDGTKLVFAHSGTDRMSLDSSGNLIVSGNITAFGTP